MTPQADDLYREFENCLLTNPGGGLNLDALRTMKSLGWRLKRFSGALDEKVDSLLGWAEILYSSRKHARWDTHYETGAQKVAHFMRCDLASLRIIIDRLQKGS